MSVGDDPRIAELEGERLAYKRLEEELITSRVFVAARKQLARWITVGGLVVGVVGLVGFNQVQSYTRSVVSKKVDKVADEQVRHTLVTEGRKQVAEMARQQR